MSIKKPAIDQKLIRDLANILTDTDLTEIEVEQEDIRIRVSRASTHVAMQSYAPQPALAPSAEQMAAPVAEDAKPAAKGNAVPAPMVGSVYLAPEPGARPFVEVGQNIKEGQTLLIIEAMKTMNQIPSPRSGKITEILVEDGQPVEFGEPMVVID